MIHEYQQQNKVFNKKLKSEEETQRREEGKEMVHPVEESEEEYPEHNLEALEMEDCLDVLKEIGGLIEEMEPEIAKKYKEEFVSLREKMRTEPKAAKRKAPESSNPKTAKKSKK